MTNQATEHEVSDENILTYGRPSSKALYEGGYRFDDAVWFYDENEMRWRMGKLKDLTWNPQRSAHPTMKIRPDDASTPGTIEEHPCVHSETGLPNVLLQSELQCDPSDASKADLLDISEPTLLKIAHCMSERLKHQTMYTRLHNAMVSINPFVSLACNDKPAQKEHAQQWETHGRGDPSAPHIWDFVQEALQEIRDGTASQHSFVITGASGSGKSVNTESVMDYLSYLTQNNKQIPTSDKTTVLEKLALQKHASTILNAMGNAKTPRNDDSSRFAKYIQLYVSDDVQSFT